MSCPVCGTEKQKCSGGEWGGIRVQASTTKGTQLRPLDEMVAGYAQAGAPPWGLPGGVSTMGETFCPSV